jgi:hypothetical protein
MPALDGVRSTLGSERSARQPRARLVHLFLLHSPFPPSLGNDDQRLPRPHIITKLVKFPRVIARSVSYQLM